MLLLLFLMLRAVTKNYYRKRCWWLHFKMACCLVTKSCLTFSLPGSSIHRISQARILEWVVISFTMGSSQPRIKPGLLLWQADSLPMSHLGPVKMGCAVLSHFRLVRLFTTQWTIALHDPLSMRFSGQEYWSGLPCPHPGDLPNPGIELASLMSPALAGRFFTTSTD